MTDWHGDKVAVLSASRTELRAYNAPEILKQVDEVVERFTNATEDVLSIHVQFIAAVDTRWRYSALSRLTYVGSGPQGQQIWTTKMTEAAMTLTQMQVQQGFRKLADQRVEMINGQTLSIKTSEPRSYAGGLQTDGAAGTAYQSKAEKLEESIVLKLSPLLTFDGDALDAIIDLTVNTVHSFHRTKVIAPRDVGPAEMAVDVPQSTQTHLDQTVKELAPQPNADHFRWYSPGHPRQKGGLVQPPDPGYLSHRDRSARLPRSRDDHSREGRDTERRDDIAAFQGRHSLAFSQCRSRGRRRQRTRWLPIGKHQPPHYCEAMGQSRGPRTS